jgi:hypothetical protein
LNLIPSAEGQAGDWAEQHYAQLPALANELVALRVAVIAATGGSAVVAEIVWLNPAIHILHLRSALRELDRRFLDCPLQTTILLMSNSFPGSMPSFLSIHRRRSSAG